MPSSPSENLQDRPITDPDHLLPPHKKSVGPLIGAIIILALLIVGAFYSWNARTKRDASATQGAYIISGTTTLPDVVR